MHVFIFVLTSCDGYSGRGDYSMTTPMAELCFVMVPR
jgi:hypothetical protein